MNSEKKGEIMEKLSCFEKQFQHIQSEYVDYIQQIYDISKDKDIIGNSSVLL